MPKASEYTDHPIRTIIVDRQEYDVMLRVGFDGIEYVGYLWFTHVPSKLPYQDHGAVPGIDALDAVRKAKEYTEREMEQRCYRALSEKRRFNRLRRATDQMINKIKHLNRVVVGLEKGMIEQESGQKELNEIQGQLLDIVKTLRDHAGVEDGEEPTRS
jgi:hypothetical protein